LLTLSPFCIPFRFVSSEFQGGCKGLVTPVNGLLYVTKPCMALLTKEASVSITKPKENKAVVLSISQGGGSAAELVWHEQARAASGSCSGQQFKRANEPAWCFLHNGRLTLVWRKGYYAMCSFAFLQCSHCQSAQVHHQNRL